MPSDTIVDEWFDFWIENIVGDLAPNTLRNYRERYVNNIQPVIGRMLLSNVRPMHCKKVLIQMDADYAGSTIRQDIHYYGHNVQSCIDEWHDFQTSDGWCPIYETSQGKR